MKFFTHLLRDEQGATAIEYGLIAALIAVAAITAMTSLGGQLETTFQGVSDSLKDGNENLPGGGSSGGGGGEEGEGEG